MEATEAGRRAKCQVTDHHRTVKAPFEQKLASGSRKCRLTFVLFECTVDHHTQPCGPLFQGVLLLQCRFEFILQALNDRCITFAYPGGLFLCAFPCEEKKMQTISISTVCLDLMGSITGRPIIYTYLNIMEIDPIQIAQHLCDLRVVLQNSTSCLCQMIQRCVSP